MRFLSPFLSDSSLLIFLTFHFLHLACKHSSAGLRSLCISNRPDYVGCQISELDWSMLAIHPGEGDWSRSTRTSIWVLGNLPVLLMCSLLMGTTQRGHQSQVKTGNVHIHSLALMLLYAFSSISRPAMTAWHSNFITETLSDVSGQLGQCNIVNSWFHTYWLDFYIIFAQTSSCPFRGASGCYCDKGKDIWYSYLGERCFGCKMSIYFEFPFNFYCLIYYDTPPSSPPAHRAKQMANTLLYLFFCISLVMS